MIRKMIRIWSERWSEYDPKDDPKIWLKCRSDEHRIHIASYGLLRSWGVWNIFKKRNIHWKKLVNKSIETKRNNILKISTRISEQIEYKHSKKKAKSYWNCLLGLNSRIFLLLNADNLLSITMPQYNSSLFMFSYSMPVYSFFAGSLPNRHGFTSRYTSAPHAHSLNAFTPYRNAGSVIREMYEEKPWSQAIGTGGGCNQAGIRPAVLAGIISGMTAHSCEPYGVIHHFFIEVNRAAARAAAEFCRRSIFAQNIYYTQL